MDSPRYCSLAPCSAFLAAFFACLALAAKRGLTPRIIAAVLCLLTVLFAVPQAVAQRSRREYISINTDVYEVSVQRDGAINIYNVGGAPLFNRMQARIRYADEEQLRHLNTDPGNATRFQVHDRLGQGQGLVFHARDCEWYVCTYPGQPYFSVRLVYRNTGSSPKTVAALAPWFSSPATDAALHIGPDAAQTQLFCSDDERMGIHRGSGRSRNMMAIHNPAAQRVLIAGFLTHNSAETYIHVAREATADSNVFTQFQALCVFEPPVVVLPGETLSGEELYIAVGDRDIGVGMERYGNAVAAVHGLQPARPRFSSGLDSSGMFPDKDATSDRLLETLQWQHEHLGDWNWRHFTVGNGWATRPGDWLPDPDRFPEGFAPLIAAAQDAGITLGLRINPFLAASDSEAAKNNPQWLLPYKREAGVYALDVSRDDVCHWLSQLAERLTKTYGFQALFLEGADCLLHGQLPVADGLTRIQLYRRGLQAIRAGMGEHCVLGVTPWHPAALPYADAIGPAVPRQAAWRHALNMNAAMTLQQYLYPTGLTPDGGVVFLRPSTTDADHLTEQVVSMTREQGVAWLAAASLSASPIRLGNHPDTLSSEDVAVLARFSPSLPRAAYNVNMSAPGTSDMRHLPLTTGAGEWHLVAFFNWSRLTVAERNFDLGALGLDTNKPYTLYEFLPGVYHGLVQGGTSLSVPPASVRLFGLRPYMERPMFIASDRHIAQGAADHQSIEWDAETKRLTGVFQADPVPYRLRVLAPGPWKFRNAHVTVENFDILHADKDILILLFTSNARQTITWYIDFE